MTDIYDYGIHVFRRDMRINDNKALIECSRRCNKVIPIFILDENQIVKNKKNKNYFSVHAVQFMCECINELKSACPLRLFYGKPRDSLKNILSELEEKKVLVTWNEDFSKYSIKRDEEMKKQVKSLGGEVLTCDTDYTLQPFLDKTFKQYGAYYKNASKIKPTKPDKTIINNFDNKIHFSTEFKKELNIFYEEKELAQKGGRKWCLDILRNSSKFSDYENKRDCLSYNTSRISGGLNFGCVSIREVYYEFVGNEAMQKQLYWRDFWLQILKNIENAVEFKHIDRRFDDNIKWKEKNVKEWNMLMNGKTGFLLVDAGIEEMKQTGYMHNRTRMIVGMFWTKVLHINPFDSVYGSQVGFSKYLLDAVGPSQNKMNHHWITELDFPGRRYGCSKLSGRPMDVSNSMIIKFDKDCKYIKKWIPELKNVPNKELYNWNIDSYNKWKLHVSPMLNLEERREEWCKITNY